MTDQKNDKKPESQLNIYSCFSGIAIQMFAIIGVGSYIEVQLDKFSPNKNNLYTIFLSLTSVIMAIFCNKTYYCSF